MYIHGNYNVHLPVHLHFGKFLLDHFRLHADAVAIENAQTGEKITYNEMIDYAIKLSVALTELGVCRGDVVALGSEKRLMFIPTALGILLSGACYTPYDFNYGKSHLQHKINTAKPKFFITTDLFWDTNREVLNSFECIKTIVTLDEPRENLRSLKTLITAININVNTFEPVAVVGQVDAAMIVYSSGTTGMPKGIETSHYNAIIYTSTHEFKEDPIDVAYLLGDWYHNYDILMAYKMLVLGKKVVYTTDLVPDILVKAFIKCQVNIVFLVPSLVILLSQTNREPNENLECFHSMYVAGSSIYAKTLEKFKERFPSVKNILQGYGTSETFIITSQNWSRKGTKLGSVGCVAPCITIKVENTKTRELLGPNQHGEIGVKGPCLMKGYIGLDPATYLDKNGFYMTGDLGYYDNDGYFYIVDRLKDLIDFDAYKVSPTELETLILQYPGVQEVGVVGKKDEVFGELPTAFIVRQAESNITEQDIIDFLSDKVAPYMELKGGVRFIDEMPKNPRGKIVRRQLCEILNASEN